MSESKALVLVFVLFGALVSAAYIGLTIAHATTEAFTATMLVIASLGAHIASRVVMHYAPPGERQRSQHETRR